tara:strand:+ start:643 stop:846 length:204 start_codon:yes stop_codon:yes gene_type:complete
MIAVSGGLLIKIFFGGAGTSRGNRLFMWAKGGEGELRWWGSGANDVENVPMCVDRHRSVGFPIEKKR